MVFVPLTVPFIMHHFGWPKYSPPPELLRLLRDTVEADETEDRDEVVILAKVLPEKINFGYQDIDGVRLLKLNGTSVTSLRQLWRQITVRSTFNLAGKL